MKRQRAFIVVLSAFLLAAAGQAQLTARRVKVRIETSGGAPVKGGTVLVTAPDRQNLRKEYLTDRQGSCFFLLPLEIKTIELSIEKEGFQPLRESRKLLQKNESRESSFYEFAFVLYARNEETPNQRNESRQAEGEAITVLNSGIAAFRESRFPEAIDLFQEAARRKPDLVEAHQNLAAAYFRAGLYADTVKSALRALELAPDSAPTLKILSIAYSRLGDESAALDWQKKLAVLPDADLTAEELYNLGIASVNASNDSEAIPCFERALVLKPEFAPAHYQLGLCFFRANDFEGAIREMEACLKADPAGQNARNAQTLLEHLKKK